MDDVRMCWFSQNQSHPRWMLACLLFLCWKWMGCFFLGHVEVNGAVMEHRRWKARPSQKLLVVLCGNLCT